ncbi:MAG: hypothetical protein KA154_07025 [Gemmatimonadaceae bacterium]|jgi:hypothetical protein|nr:hypothetical protein [Acidobacteriota bacterium]MBP6772738.1 hypothetical protein [Gemmatimonadaceae bacterium]MCC6430347.1 hypothetical protein [Gemmatimonadaceae bacterium]
MASLYWICLLLGGGVVLLQLIASVVGLDHDAPHDVLGHGAASEGLHLFSIRALAAAVAFFGVGGLAAQSLGAPALLTPVAGAVAGVAAAAAVATLMRGMRRLESDQSFRLATAVGQSGDVYLSIPAHRGGTGKVHITLQERLMELDAVTTEEFIDTGARVLVIDTIAPATVVVVREPRILEEGNDPV